MKHAILAILFCTLFSTNLLFGQAENSPHFIVHKITIIGNNKTKDRIIHIALDIAVGDTILRSDVDNKLQWAKNNLRNTYLFNDVDVIHHPVGTQYTELIVTLQERWYLWPLPLLENAETNFNTWWQRKDFSRLNYGIFVMQENFRGRSESFGTQIQLGYSKKFGLIYKVPYASPKGKTGVSLYAGYAQNHEVVTGTQDNLRIFHTGDDGRTREQFESRLGVTQRPNFYQTHDFTLSFRNYTIKDTVVQTNENYLGQGKSQLDYLSFSYHFRHDRRDYKPYPLKGYYLDLLFTQHGLFGKNLNLTTSYIGAKAFTQFAPRFYGGIGTLTKFTLQGEPPYLLVRGLGYRDYVRGYEYHVIDGNHFMMLKSNVKYELVPRKNHKLPFIKNPRFKNFYYALYWTIFADAGYVMNDFSMRGNDLANTWLSSFGTGIDFLTYYDTVIRVEFSMNRLKEGGFFLHFTQPI